MAEPIPAQAENEPTFKLETARTRSVDNLQRLYTVVISLAVTESLRRLLASLPESGALPDYKNSLMVVSLIVTVVPFYHGANRYLDATYVIGERFAIRIALMVDFLFIFLEGLLFFVLGMVTHQQHVFYTILTILLVIDVIWVGSTFFTSTSQSSELERFKKWATINVATAFLILFISWSKITWDSEAIKNIILAAIVASRTVADYMVTWHFYYPKDK